MASEVPRVIGDNAETRRFLDSLARSVRTLESATLTPAQVASLLSQAANGAVTFAAESGVSSQEGGQFQLQKPNSTSLSDNVVVDIYNNSIRIFEGGGSVRGASIDLTACATGIGTSLLGGLTLLSSASVGTGGTYSVTGLDGYKVFFVVLRGVSHNSGSNQTIRVALSGNNGSSYGTAFNITTTSFTSANAVYGCYFIDRVDQTNNQAIVLSNPFSPASAPEDTSSLGPVNALQHSFSGGNFDAGSIDIYGLK